ncbi:MAG: hypothetical protein QM758_06935 [Armatimonas sp.]
MPSPVPPNGEKDGAAASLRVRRGQYQTLWSSSGNIRTWLLFISGGGP